MFKIKDFGRVIKSRNYGLLYSCGKCWHSEHGECYDVQIVIINLEYRFYFKWIKK